MAEALRQMPVILDIARDMREVAAGTLLTNFNNPSGLVTEALFRYAPDVPVVGVCNVALHAKMDLTKVLERQLNCSIDPSRTQLKTLGLNHLTWHYGFTLDGEEMWPRLMEQHLAELRSAPEPEWDVRTIESLQMMPNYYLQYFYYTQRKLAEQQAWPPSRAEEVMAIEDSLLRQYADPDRSEPPADLMKRGGAYYSTVATQLLNAHYNDLGETHVANVRHNGAVPGWPANWVLELPCRVDRSGVHPLAAKPLPPVCFGLIAQVKAYELLTVEAAVQGDRQAAYQALVANPLGPSADRVQTGLDELLETPSSCSPQSGFE